MRNEVSKTKQKEHYLNNFDIDSYMQMICCLQDHLVKNFHSNFCCMSFVSYNSGKPKVLYFVKKIIKISKSLNILT